jgi:hypothetical protein
MGPNGCGDKNTAYATGKSLDSVAATGDEFLHWPAHVYPGNKNSISLIPGNVTVAQDGFREKMDLFSRTLPQCSGLRDRAGPVPVPPRSLRAAGGEPVCGSGTHLFCTLQTLARMPGDGHRGQSGPKYLAEEIESRKV